MIDPILTRAVESGRLAGIVAAAATRDRPIHIGAAGLADVEKQIAMERDSLFRIASMTKAVTSVAAMQLVEHARVALDQPAADYLPALARVRVLEGFDEASGEPRLRPPRTQMTVRELLTHSSGFAYEIWNADIARYRAQTGLPSAFEEGRGFLAAPMVRDPGERWEYGISSDWLGELIAAVSGRTLDTFLREEIFEPLGMSETHFGESAEKVQPIVAVQQRQADGSLVQIPFELPAQEDFYSGGAGLVSTADDYLRFLRMILCGGSLDGVRILDSHTVDAMAAPQLTGSYLGDIPTADPVISNDVHLLPGLEKAWGLGFLINLDDIESLRSAGSLCWAGVFNTYYWIDRKSGVCGATFSQILPFFDAEMIATSVDYERAVYESIR